jgi:hypothetical protein
VAMQALKKASYPEKDNLPRTPTHGYEPTREAAMAAFAKRLAEVN